MGLVCVSFSFSQSTSVNKSSISDLYLILWTGSLFYQFDVKEIIFVYGDSNANGSCR